MDHLDQLIGKKNQWVNNNSNTHAVNTVHVFPLQNIDPISTRKQIRSKHTAGTLYRINRVSMITKQYTLGHTIYFYTLFSWISFTANICKYIHMYDMNVVGE